MPAKYSFLFNFESNPANGVPAVRRSASWTESHWRAAADRTNLQLQALGTERAVLLSGNSRIELCRVTTFDLVNDKLQQKGVQIVPLGLPGTNALATDIPQMALQLKWNATAPNVNVATSDLRAIPDARVVGGEYDFQAAYNGQVQTYLNDLVDTAWGFMGINFANNKVRVLGLAAGVLKAGAGHGLVAGNVAQLYRTISATGKKLTGLYVVDSVVGNDITLEGIDATASITVPNGYIRRAQPIFCDYANYTIVRIRTHKVGRPFAPYRGRARAA